MGCPRKFCHRSMYIAPSSDHSLLNHYLAFKLLLRMFEVVSWCQGWECCTFYKKWWKFIQIQQYYILIITAIIAILLLPSPVRWKLEWVYCIQGQSPVITWWIMPGTNVTKINLRVLRSRTLKNNIEFCSMINTFTDTDQRWQFPTLFCISRQWLVWFPVFLYKLNGRDLYFLPTDLEI